MFITINTDFIQTLIKTFCSLYTVNTKRPLKLILALMVFYFTRIFTFFPMGLTILVVWNIRTTFNFLYYLFKLFSTYNCWRIIYYLVLRIIEVWNIFYESFFVNFVNGRITLPAYFSFLSIFSMVRFDHCDRPIGEEIFRLYK